MDNKYAIELLGITKVFPGVIANDDITLRVRENEIHALLGENGAGKSTLMSILFGLYDADTGKIIIKGTEAFIKDPNDANALGIGMVHQHFKLVHNYTVAENVILGMEPRTKSGNVDIAAAEKRVHEISALYGLRVDPRARVEGITVGMQQRVEILKTLYRNAEILIFDEPTAVLTPQEVDELMAILRRLKAEGKTIILITHKLREIKEAADRCTVLRRGRLVGTVDVAGASEEAMAEMMVGRAVNFRIDKAEAKPGPVVLKIEGLTVKGAKGHEAVRALDLEVRAGEIVGIAGVDGNGQAELIEAITGLSKPVSGRVLLKGEDVGSSSIRDRIRRGIGHVPEDRHKNGLVLKFRLDENLVLKTFAKPPYSGFAGILDFRAIASHAEALISQFDIRAGRGSATTCASMSGGNQQKAIIAREIDLSPELLVVAQPTRGLDVGAIEYIHERIIAERDKGRAVLLVSFELDEIMALCDRIAAISKGEIVGIVDAKDADEREIGAMMAGLKGQDCLMAPDRPGLVDRLASSNAAMSVVVVLLGFLVGTILVLAVGRDPANMYRAIIQVVSGWDLARGTWNARYIGEWLVASTPLVLCGLSMAFAARAGLFNIGAEGQYIVGLTVAQFSAFILPPIPGFHWAASIALAMLAGSAWGGIVGFLKAKYAVSEVVATIMMNYIALYSSRYATQFIPGTNTYKTPSFPDTARLSNHWLEAITNNSRLNTGLFLMIASVLLFWFVMEKTRTGFALRATGFNKDAARCSGINVRRSLTLSMAISGAFAGLAGGIVALGSFGYGRVLAGLDGYGFNGIAVALVGNSTAIGTFLAGLLFGMLQSAQPLMQSRQIPKEITYIISGLVVVFISLRSGIGLLLEARSKQQVKAAARKGVSRDE